MMFNINATDLLGEIYEKVQYETPNQFNSNDNKSVVNVLILTMYNEIVNKGNLNNLIFTPAQLENIKTPNVKLQGLQGDQLRKVVEVKH